MSNVATLGIDVKVNGADKAAADLDKVTAKSEEAESATDRLGSAATASSAKITSAARAAARAAERQAASAAKAAAAANDNAKRFSGSMSGIAAQFQDVGVTAASGMSPLMIGLQQGSQIAGAMEQAMQGGASAASALRMAFSSLLSPLTLISVGLTVAAAAVVQWAFSSSNETDKATEALKSHEAVLKQIKDRYPEMTISAQNYAASIERLGVVEGRNAESLEAKYNSSLSALREGINSVYSVLSRRSETRSVLETSSDIEGLNELKSVLDEYMKSVAAGTPNVDALSHSISKLSNQSSNEIVRDMSGALSDLANNAAEAKTNLSGTVETIDAINKRMAAAAPVVVTFGNELVKAAEKAYSAFKSAMVQTQYPGYSAPLPPTKPNIESIDPVRTGSKRDVYASAIASSQKKTDALNAETEAQRGLTQGVNDYGYAVSFAKEKAELLNAAEQQKKAITPELTAQIEAQAKAYADATVESQKLKESQKKAKEEAAFNSGLMKGFITDLISARKSGESFWSAFRSAASNALDKIASKLLDSIIDPLFSAGGSSGGGIFSSIGKLLGYASGGYTGNAPASAVAGVVHGGEYVFSKRAVDRIGLGTLDRMHKGYAAGGYVAPAAPVAANSNTVVQIAPASVNINGNADTNTAAEIKQILDQHNRELPSRVVAAVMDARGRGKL